MSVWIHVVLSAINHLRIDGKGKLEKRREDFTVLHSPGGQPNCDCLSLLVCSSSQLHRREEITANGYPMRESHLEDGTFSTSSIMMHFSY